MEMLEGSTFRKLTVWPSRDRQRLAEPMGLLWRAINKPVCLKMILVKSFLVNGSLYFIHLELFHVHLIQSQLKLAFITAEY